MAGESIQYANSSNPQTWTNILGGIARDFGSAAASNLARKEDQTRTTQQAPLSGSELRTWIPWIIGGAVLVAVLLFARK